MSSNSIARVADEELPLILTQADASSEENLPLRLKIGIGFTWMASFLAALDSTITSTISATVANEFGSLTIISWLASAYLIALTATQPLAGKLTDLYGRRTGILFCVLLFATGNLVCGIAQSEAIVIAGRVLAGVGGGGCNVITTVIGNDLISIRKRGLVQGFGSVVYGCGVGLGGVIGGSLNQWIGWRWAFLILIPLSFVSAIGTLIFLPPLVSADAGSRLNRVDFLGSILLVASLAAFLIGLNNDTQNTLALVIALPSAAVLFIAFILVETCVAKEPVVSLKALRSRTVLAACMTSWFYSMAFYTTMFYVPLYFQLRGFGTAETGALLITESVGTAVGSLGAGVVTRITGRYGILKICVLLIFLGGAGGFTAVSLDTSVALPEIFLFCNGLGFGGTLTTLILAILSAIDHEHQAVTTSVYYAFRSTGATIGVTASGTLFRALLANYRSDKSPGHSDFPSTPDFGHRLPWDGGDKGAFMYALRGTFALATAFGVAGFLCGTLTKNYELSSKAIKPSRR